MVVFTFKISLFRFFIDFNYFQTSYFSSKNKKNHGGFETENFIFFKYIIIFLQDVNILLCSHLGCVFIAILRGDLFWKSEKERKSAKNIRHHALSLKYCNCTIVSSSQLGQGSLYTGGRIKDQYHTGESRSHLLFNFSS